MEKLDIPGCSSVDAATPPRPIVAIPDYLPANGFAAARRSMTETLLKAGLLPVVLPEMDDAAADQFLSHCDAVMIGGGTSIQDYDRRCAYEDRILALATKRGLVIAGICHGCQVINRHFGGTLAPVPEGRELVHKDVELYERTGGEGGAFRDCAAGGFADVADLRGWPPQDQLLAYEAL